MRKIILLLGIFASSLSEAAVVTPATFSTRVTMSGDPGFNAQGLTAPIIYQDDVIFSNESRTLQGIASVVQTGGFQPQIDIQTHADYSMATEFVYSAMQVTATSSIVYSMMIDGPATQLVPVNVSVLADISGTVDTFGDSNIYGRGAGSITILNLASWNIESRWNTACPAGSNCVENGGSSLSTTQTFDMVPGNEYFIFMTGKPQSLPIEVRHLTR